MNGYDPNQTNNNNKKKQTKTEGQFRKIPMAERRFSVGYALAPKKQSSFIQTSLINLAKDNRIDLIKIDTDKPLIQQGPFDLVLHKIYGPEWKLQLSDYSAKHPNVLIIDSPDSIERLHNRISMLQVVMELKTETTMTSSSTSSFGIPKQTVVYDEVNDAIDLEGEGLRFPVIAKPLVADGSAKSHKMALVFNRVGLRKLRPPVVLQEFVNHGGVIFKVYVVGEHVKCVTRKSLPDVDEENLKDSSEGSLPFSQVSNLNSVEKKIDDDSCCYGVKDLEDGGRTEFPPMNLLVDIARGLRRALGLHLFNFDLIRDTRIGNRYLVVDINYFPGYAKMPNYERVMTDFFWDVLNKRKESGKNEDGGLDCCERGRIEKEVRILVSNTDCDEDGGGDGAANLPVSPLKKRDEKENPIQV